MSAFGPSAFGLDPEPSRAEAASPPVAVDRRSEARFALLLSGGGLAAVYAISSVTATDRVPAAGALLAAIFVLQAGWLLALGYRTRGALAAGAALNLLLLGVWAISRARGLPIGAIDTLSAMTSLAIVALALTTIRVRAPGAALLSQAAIVLAIASLSALGAGGHTSHRQPAAAAGAPGAPPVQFLCRLL